MAKLLIVAADFYKDITDMLIDGATSRATSLNHDFELIVVPGALEVAGAISMAISTRKYDAYVALGCVIRGETSHYDTVCDESARAIGELVIKEHAAIGNGILTVENRAQAIARADKNDKNKGAGAVDAALSLLSLKNKWKI